MQDESDLSVPSGIDIDHKVELSIDAVGVDHEPCEFVCPRCGQQLTKKLKDRLRRRHFAHHMNATDRNCPWRDDAGIRQTCTQSRDQALKDAQNIRIFLQRRPHSQELALFGAVPPLSNEDISKVGRGKLEGALRIDSLGTRKRVELMDLLPSGRAGWVELDPAAAEFRIEIRPVELVNGGSWVARGLCPGDTFVGDSNWGRLVSAPRRVSGGQSLYVVGEAGVPAKLPFEEEFRLGRYHVNRLTASVAQLAALKEILPKIDVDFESLRVDVVSPLSVPPSDTTLGRILLPRGQEALISVSLPKDKDRSIEVFPIPFNGTGQVTIPPAGLGVPRFLRLNLVGEESQRILIHWPFESERDSVLDFIPVELPPTRSLAQTDPVIGLSWGDGLFLNPLEYPSAAFEAKTDPRGNPALPRISLIAPEGFFVTLKGEFPGEGGSPIWLEEPTRVDRNAVEARVKDVYSRGCRTLLIGFGSLGSVTLVSTGFYETVVARTANQRRVEEARAEAVELAERSRQAELEKVRRAEERKAWRERMQEKIRQSLRKRGEPTPKHLSEVVVRRLLSLPPDTSREDLRILRNLVSRARRDLRSHDGPETPEMEE